MASSKVPELFTSVPPTWVGNPSKPPGCSDGQRSTRRVRPKKPTGQGVSLTPSSGNVDLNQQQIRCSDVFQRFLCMSFKSSLYGPVGYVCQLFVILVPVPKKGSPATDRQRPSGRGGHLGSSLRQVRIPKR